MIGIGLLLVALAGGLVLLVSRRGTNGGGIEFGRTSAPEREDSLNARLYVAAVIGGLLALAITIVLVFQFGRHDPSPPSLTDNPNAAIPGKILYVN